MVYAALPALAAACPAAAVEPSLTADIATAAEQARCQNDILSHASEDEAGMAVAALSANAPAAAAAAAAASPPETVSPAATTAARAAAAAANAIGSMRHVCEVCGEGEGIYRCARCLRRSCSLRCYKQHERESVMAAAVGAEKVAAASATTACARANQAAAAAARAAAAAASARGKASVSSAAAEEEAAAAAAGGTAVWNVSEEIVTFNASATGTETRAAACPLVRPRVHAVPLQQFDEDQLVRDLRLLDGAARAVESAARVWRSEAEEALHREAKKKKRAFCSPQQLRSACAQRQIRFFFCPPAFSRRRLNTTRPVYRAEQQQQQRVQQEEEQQREPVQQQEDRAKPEEPREGEEQSLCQENEWRPATEQQQQQQQPKRRDQVQLQREQGEEHMLEEEGGKQKKQHQQSSTKQEKGGEDQTKEDEEEEVEEEQGQTEQSEQQEKAAHQRRTHQQQEDGEKERKTLLPEHSRRVNAAACAGAAVRQKQLLIEWRLVLRFPGGATQRVLPHVNENLPLEEVVQRVFAQERAAAAAAKHRKQQQQQEQSLLRGSLRREANEAAAGNRDPAVTTGKQTAATPRRDAATAVPASPCPAEEDKRTTTPRSPATAAPDTSKQAELVEILAPETGAATASTCTAALGSASSSAYAADTGCTVAADYPAGVRAIPAPAAHSSTTPTACSSVIPAAASADKTCISAPPAADTATTSSAAVPAPALRTIGNVCDSVGESSVVGESSAAATSGSAGAGESPTSVEETSPLVVYMKAKELIFLLPLLGVRKPPQSSPSLSGVPVSPLFAATHLPPSASLSSLSSAAGGSNSCCVADGVVVPSARRADAGVEARTDDNTFDSATGRPQGANEHGQQEVQQSEEAEDNCEKKRGASSAFRPLVRRCSGKMTVREALRNSVVVEFPEFLVVLPEELQQYHCVGDRTGELPIFSYCHASTFTAAHNPSDVLFSTGDWPAAVVGTPATTDSAPAACPGRAASIVLAEHKLHLQAQQPASNSSSENCETEEDGIETSSEEEGGVRADDDNEEKNTKANEEAIWRGRGSFKCFPNRGGRQVQQHSTRKGCVNASCSNASATGAAAGCRAAPFADPLMSRRGGRETGCPDRRLFRGAIGRGIVLPRENMQQQGRTMTDATEEPSKLLQCQPPQLDHQNKQPLQHHWPQQQQQRQSWQKQQQQRQRHHPQCRQQERKLSQKEQSASGRGSSASPASRRGSSRGRAFRGGKRGRFC